MIIKLGFDVEWVARIMQCIDTVSYSVVLSGAPGMVFTLERRLGQGDPISPLLFLICSEGLSTLLRLATEEGRLKGIKVSRRGPQISHLLFADDCILFREATEMGIATFEQVLKEYEECSGQCINYGKSTVFFSSNTLETVQLGVKRSNNSKNYLGLPNMVGRKKCGAFQHLKDRIKMKIDSWITRKRGIHWCPWNKLGELKDGGGLGYCNLAKFNLALFAKQGWRLIDNLKSLLARTLKAKYHPNSDFLSLELGNLPSYTWKSIWVAKGLLLSGLSWRVGNGRNIKIEEDVWVPNVNGLLIKKTVNRQDVTKVEDLIDNRNRIWRFELISSTFSEEVTQKIMLIPLAHLSHEDFLSWRGEASGEYTVRSGYKIHLQSNENYNPSEINKCYRKL
ncbi:reverse transcriptase [Gossypium australe]|uniref:Reverse transcriptase n=1 Tax=Gossypium australe TaxID=47621 RepID=A0A5B6UF91_9ROSI|nr:reverse transcriptase [Gossypium australe]